MGMIRIGNQFINSNNILQAEITELTVPTLDDRRQLNKVDKALDIALGIASLTAAFLGETYDDGESPSYGVKYPVLKLTINEPNNEPHRFAVVAGRGAGITPTPAKGLIFISNKKRFKEDIDAIFKTFEEGRTNSRYGNGVKTFLSNYGNCKFVQIDEDLESFADRLFS